MPRPFGVSSNVIAGVAFGIALLCTCAAAWAFGAQDRVSSDLVDVRNEAPQPSDDGIEGHIVWVQKLLNGGAVSPAEVEGRLSAGFLQDLPAEQFLAETRVVVNDGPFEFRGFVIDRVLLAAQGYAQNDQGRVYEFSLAAQPADPERLAGLLGLVADPPRGPFNTTDIVLVLLAGWSLAAAGVVLTRHGAGGAGLILLAVAAVWFGQLLELSDQSVVYTIGLACGPLAVAGLGVAALWLAFPASANMSERRVQRLLAALMTVAGLVGLSPLLAIDTTVSDLPQQLLNLSHDPGLARTLTSVRNAAVLFAACVAFVVMGWYRFQARRRPEVNIPLVLGGAVTALLVGVLAASSIGSDHFDLSLSPFLAVAAITLAAGVAVVELQERQAFGEIVGLMDQAQSGGVNDAAATRSGLQQVLASALRDPSLELVFWSPDDQCYVDSQGRSADVGASDTRSVTLLESDSAPIGAALHDPALHQQPRRLRAACAAAGLAIDNERLQALVRSQLTEVQASRARLVESAEEARRRIERDLHDGAQQRLLALSLSVEVERKRVQRFASEQDRSADERAEAESIAGFLSRTSEELGDAVAELRELGRGLHPSALDRGLRVAVNSLAERSSVPVVANVVAERFPKPVEAAAYFVIQEALANATRHAETDHVRVCAESTPGGLVVRVADDGVGGADAALGSGLRSLEDRVIALGGTWRLRSPAGCGTELVAAFPDAANDEVSAR